MENGDLEHQTVVRREVADVMAMPYVWPASVGAAAGAGSCSSKHALLAERLAAVGVSSRPLFVVGPLVPSLLARDPRFAGGVGLLEVHECLTVSMAEVGPLVVDVTWDPPLVQRGLPGTLDWDGRSDMALAIGPVVAAWAPDSGRRSEEKEALRARLYGGEQRATRDRVLALMSHEFAAWRSAAA